VATAGGNHAVSAHFHIRCHRPLKAETQVRIPVAPTPQHRGIVQRCSEVSGSWPEIPETPPEIATGRARDITDRLGPARTRPRVQ
jgi:hypothetical protein